MWIAVIFIVNFIIFSIILYMLHQYKKRNDDVYRFRTKVLREHGLKVYKTMPDYGEMVRKWWIPLKLENWAYVEKEGE